MRSISRRTIITPLRSRNGGTFFWWDSRLDLSRSSLLAHSRFPAIDATRSPPPRRSDYFLFVSPCPGLGTRSTTCVLGCSRASFTVVNCPSFASRPLGVVLDPPLDFAIGAAPRSRLARPARRDPATRRADGGGESHLGLHADPRRSEERRASGRTIDDRPDPQCARHPAGAETPTSW